MYEDNLFGQEIMVQLPQMAYAFGRGFRLVGVYFIYVIFFLLLFFFCFFIIPRQFSCAMRINTENMTKKKKGKIRENHNNFDEPNFTCYNTIIYIFFYEK